MGYRAAKRRRLVRDLNKRVRALARLEQEEEEDEWVEEGVEG